MNRDAFMESMAAEINRRQDELIALETAFEKLGGSFDEPEKPAKMKLLTGPKPKKKKGRRKTAPPPVGRGGKASFAINGQEIAVKPRQLAVLELLQQAKGELLSRTDIAQAWGSMPNFPVTIGAINKKIRGAGIHIVLVPRQGYRLDKLK